MRFRKTIKDHKNFTDDDLWQFYRANRRHQSKAIYRNRQFKNIVSRIFWDIRQCLIHNPHGICLEDFGYLGWLRSPYKKRFKLENAPEDFRKKFLKDYRYQPLFFPSERFKEWHLDGSFEQGIVETRDHSKDYKMHAGLCESYVNQQESARLINMAQIRFGKDSEEAKNISQKRLERTTKHYL